MKNIIKFFKTWKSKWKHLLGNKSYKFSLIIGVISLITATFIMKKTSAFVDNEMYPAVGDLILDAINTVNVEFLFVWGFYSIIASIFIYPIFFKPEIAPFMLKTFAIMMVVRSIAISLTHVGPPDGFFYDQMSDLINNPLKDLFFRNDLFFSGHTAFPFLAFLVFKETKFRWFMLAASILMGITVLLMHVHYSIDVFAAFFIAHGVYTITDKIFNKLNLRFAKHVKQMMTINHQSLRKK